MSGVSVFTHQLANVTCTTWVTDGLRSFGQREIAFTALRGAAIDPMPLLSTIAGLARQGRIVGPGDVTEVGPGGLFGRPHLRGLAYETAWPMDGVELPPDTLHAIVLVGPEMDVVQRFGVLRTLARLGEANHFFPTTPWCDPNRAPVCGEEKSILEGVASAHFPGVSVLRDGEQIRVRLQKRSRDALRKSGLPPPDAAVAFLTELDRTADACLVWTPGRRELTAIGLPGGTGARLAGCFVLFCPQQKVDNVGPFEDGFAAMLTDASWARIRDALMNGTSLAIGALSIEWNVPAVSEMKMHLREPQADIESRLGMQSLVAYAEAVEKIVQAAFAGQQGRGAVFEIDVVLGAGRPPIVRCSDPSITARIVALGSPPLRSGEIGFRGSFDLFGGPD